MKNLTDFRKTVETGVDPPLDKTIHWIKNFYLYPVDNTIHCHNPYPLASYKFIYPVDIAVEHLTNRGQRTYTKKGLPVHGPPLWT